MSFACKWSAGARVSFTYCNTPNYSHDCLKNKECGLMFHPPAAFEVGLFLCNYSKRIPQDDIWECFEVYRVLVLRTLRHKYKCLSD